MQITLNIDEELFNSTLGKALNDLKPEQLNDILIECIREYFLGNDGKNIEKLLYEEHDPAWGRRQTFITNFTNKLINDCDYSGLQEVADKCITNIKENSDKILKDILAEMMIRGLCDKYNFQERVKDAISDEMIRRNN